VAATRIWARSATAWDWDETLFCLGVRSYDVAQHHPHPPGFPLYLALAKFVRLFVHSDFHALQAIVTVSAIALFPILFWLAWELRFPFRTAFLGPLLFVFLPNVWFYGGTAFSDVPGLALLLAACAMLLRGCRDRRAYFAAAILLGLAAAIRPQALLVGCAPAVVASLCRIRERRARDVVAASAIGIAVIAISYSGAALASHSVGAYLEANHRLSEYVRHVDSFLSPDRPPVLTLFSSFFVRAVPGGRTSDVIAALALVAIVISIARRDRRVWLLVAMFLPFNVFGWFMLDTNSISRYSVSYLPMYTILAAHALAFVPLLETFVVAAITARLILWTVPALRDVRHTESPPVAAMRWITRNVPRSTRLIVYGAMQPWSEYDLAGYHTTVIIDPARIPRPFRSDDLYLTEGSTSIAGGRNFVRARDRLFDLARQRYFEVSLAPATGLWQFGPGWYGEESDGATTWRWMQSRSETRLPPVAGNARLTLRFNVPPELVARRPSVAVTFNGAPIDSFVVTTTSVEKSWIVRSQADRWNVLAIAIDKVINPAKEHITDDPRDLGLDLMSYSWTPVP